MQRPPFSPFPGLAAKPYFMPLMIDHAVHAPEVELLARDAQQPELGSELHFGEREGELDQILRKLTRQSNNAGAFGLHHRERTFETSAFAANYVENTCRQRVARAGRKTD